MISTEGEAELLAEGPEEELLILHVAEDAEVFPHVVTLPQRVLLIEEEVSTAIELEPDERVRFELREQEGYPYVGLVLLRAGDEVARYLWDPDELVFMGPLIDKLPDPPGGKFLVNIDASARLEPLGGELPEPKPIPETPPDLPEQPAWGDDLLPA